MGYFFVDIETYIDEKNNDTGLNPYYPESKVIVISFNFYNSFILTEKNIIPPTIYKEWESSEKEILSKFYNFLKNKVESDPHIKLVGFNHIKFDLPYLFARLLHHKIDTPENLHKIIFQTPHHIDLSQIGMITSQRMFNKKEFYNVNHNECCRFFELPEKSESGIKVSEYYNNHEFDKIEKYVIGEFILEHLYILLRRFIHAKKTMEKIEGLKNEAKKK